MASALPTSDVHGTLSFIEDLALPHPGGALLASFVLEAMNPEVAAGFIRSEATSESKGRKLVADWIHIVESISTQGTLPEPLDGETVRTISQRDGNRCCVTGRPGTLVDPLAVVPVLPFPVGWVDDESTHRLLGIFFGSPYRDWWLDYTRSRKFASPLHNHWLVRKSVSNALQRGLVKLARRPTSQIEFEVSNVAIGDEEPVKINGPYALLGDYSRMGVEKVDPRIVGSLGRFCTSIQLVAVAREAAPELFLREPVEDIKAHEAESSAVPPSLPFYFHQPRQSGLVITRLITSPLLAFWTLFPRDIRICVYKLLQNLGRQLYGPPSGTANAQRLPFGLYLKTEIGSLQNEYNALRTIRRHTSIPVPEPLDVVDRPARAGEPFSRPESYLLTTRMRGVTMAQSYNAMSDTDFTHITLQLRDYVAQLRGLPRFTGSSESAICNTLGGACSDPRIRGGESVGPFESEADFNQMVRFSDDPGRQGHKVVFSHADLNPRNIMVERATSTSGGKSYWRVSGILDWETAGYYPEYWEYTKAMYESVRWPKRYNNLVEAVFGPFGSYTRELDVERRSWESGDGA